MCPSKTQISLHIAHKKYKMTECTYRRLRSVCTSSQQKLQVGRMRPSKTQISLHIFTPKLQVYRMRPSKTQISLHIFTPKVTSWPYVPIEDSDQSAHLHTKSYKLTVCAHRRLRSVCTSSHQKLQVDHMHLSKTQFSLPILAAKVTSWPYAPQSKTQFSLRIFTAKVTSWNMRPSKTQIKLHIFTPQVTSWPYAPIEDSAQSAHRHSKSYKLTVCAHRRISSVCASSQQKLQVDRMRRSKTQFRLHIVTAKVTSWHMCPSKTQIRLHIVTAKVTSWPYATIEDSDQTAHRHSKSYKLTVCAHRRRSSVCTSCTKSYKLTVCAHRRLSSVCPSSQQKLQVDRISPSKTQFSLPILAAKVTSWPYAPQSKTQFSLCIFTAKVTSWQYAPIEDSVQSAHCHTKSYKLTVCDHRRLRSDCSSRTKSYKLTVCDHRRLRSDCSSRTKSYKLTVCDHRRLSSVCTFSQQKLQVDRMHLSKANFSLPILAAKVTSWPYAPLSKTQFSLHIFTAKVTSWPYMPIEDPDQTAHLHAKSYKLTVCAHRRISSVCASSQQKGQLEIRDHRSRFRSDRACAQ